MMKKSILLFIMVGAIIASFAVFVGVKHNSMGEFCVDNDLDNCIIDWLFVIQLWLFWFIPVFLIPTSIIFFGKLLISKIKHR
jgi:hypothetical protein